MNEVDVIDGVMNFINAYLTSLDQLDKSLLKEYISVLYDISNRVKSNEGVMPFIDEFFLTRLNELLDSIRQFDHFNSNIDSGNLSLCVMSCIITQFTFYVYDENCKYEGMLALIDKQVSLILHGNILK